MIDNKTTGFAYKTKIFSDFINTLVYNSKFCHMNIMCITI